MDTLRIGDVAMRVGVSVDTVRHYEQKGVLRDVTRDGSGYRCYTEASVERIRVVRRALAIGFTLDELARIFRQRDAGQPPCRGVRDLAARKLADLDARIAELTTLRATLSRTMEAWDLRLDATATGGFAGLLETLTDERRNG